MILHSVLLALAVASVSVPQPGQPGLPGPIGPIGPIGQDVELALGGLDPVALCGGETSPGDASREESWGLYTYRFASAENRARFLADPERWCIQWDGGCARMGPLSGKGSPERYAVHDGRIYIFASDGCRDGFLADAERFVPGSDEASGEAGVGPATDAQRAQGRRWIERALEAHGGARAVDRPAALRWTARGETGGWRFERVLTVGRGSAVERRSTWIPPEGDPEATRSETVWSVGGVPDGAREARGPERSAAYASIDGRRHALTSPDAIVDVRRIAAREPITLLRARDAADFDAVHLGAGRLEEREVVDVLVRAHGLETTLHLDPTGGSVLGVSWRGRLRGGVTQDVVEVFTAWTEVEGLRLPLARRVLADGAERADLGAAWSSIEVPAAGDRSGH